MTSPDTVEIPVAVVRVLREVSWRQRSARQSHLVATDWLNHARAVVARTVVEHPGWAPSLDLRRGLQDAEMAIGEAAWAQAELSHCIAFFCDVFVGGTLSNPGKPEAFRRVVIEKRKRTVKDRLRRVVAFHDFWVREEVERAGRYLRAADRNFYDAQQAADGARAQRQAEEARRAGYPTSWGRIDAEPPFGVEDPACRAKQLADCHLEPAAARDGRRSAWERIDAEEGSAGCTDDGVLCGCSRGMTADEPSRRPASLTLSLEDSDGDDGSE
jgi:hypothetical protein